MFDLDRMVANGDQIATEHTSSKQDGAMAARAEQLAQSGHNYNGATCNCDQFVKDVLGQADKAAADALHLVPFLDFRRLENQAAVE
jgi:hypothetical protein